MEVKADYLAIFRDEAHDQLREWEEALLSLEKHPEDGEQVNRMFRAVHTIKGSAGFIEFGDLQSVTHALETSLQQVREGAKPFDDAVSDILFRGLDICRDMIVAFVDGKPSTADAAGLLGRIEAEGSRQETPAPRCQPEPREEGELPGESPAGQPRSGHLTEAGATDSAPVAGAQGWRIQVRIDAPVREAWMKSLVLRKRLERSGRILGTDPDPERLRDSGEEFAYTIRYQSRLHPGAMPGLLAVDQVQVIDIRVDSPVPQPGPGAQAAPRPGRDPLPAGSRPEEVVRVSVQKMDALLNLVGELVIQNSGFVSVTERLRGRVGKTLEITELEGQTEGLSKITRELQDGIMKARMLPFSNVFRRFHRVVRDLARVAGKDVALELLGEETEVDKKVIDRIGEPLVHLVRNAVDHGIEPCETRVAAGKPAAGTVRLHAFHEGDHICIEVSDDGRGLDRDAIIRKAVEKRLLTPDAATKAGAEQVLGLIFLPGFSTAAQVTDISGRGVGMDVVKRAVDAMGGSVRVRSTPGQGTTVTVALPLTTAIITAVLAQVRDTILAIPLAAVREILKTRESVVGTVGTRKVIRVRDEILALVPLGQALTMGSRGAPCTGPERRRVVVVGFEGKKLGLEVDRIQGTREIVIKSLSRHYREIDGLTGASILGDGSIALIVDVESLVRLYHHADHPGNGHASAPAAVVPAFTAAEGAAAPAAPALAEAPEPVAPHTAVPGDPGPASVLRAEPPDPAPGAPVALRSILLEEVNNNGAIHASIALSQLTGQEIRVTFPESRLVPLPEVADTMGGEETEVGGIYVGVEGEMPAGVLMVAPTASLRMIDDLLHRGTGTAGRLSEVDQSGLSEMGNILAASFINALAGAARMRMKLQVPEIRFDMCLAVIDSVLARFSQPGDRVLITEALIYWGASTNVVCHLALFLDPPSLSGLLAALETGSRNEG